MAKFPNLGPTYDMTRPPSEVEFTDIVTNGTRAQMLQRMQIGIAGILLMVLLVGLAGMIKNRAAEAEATSVPEAVPTVQPSATPAQSDPLVEAGVVPDMPVEQPDPTPTLSPAPVPEQGTGNGAPLPN